MLEINCQNLLDLVYHLQFFMRTDYYSEKNHQLLFSIYDSSKKEKLNQFRNHRHSELEISFIINGTGTYFLNQIPFEISTWDLIIVRPNEPHCVPTITSHNLISFNIHFSSYYLYNICPDFIEPFKLHALMHSEISINHLFIGHNELISLIMNISTLFHENKDSSRFKIRLHMLNFIATVSNKIINSNPNVHLKNNHFHDIHKSINYIKQNHNSPITLYDISRAATMSRSHFARTFKSVTGTTPYEYLLSFRIEKACQLLTKTDLSILQISIDCGFCNVTNFNRAFKQKMGESPTAFRLKYQCSIKDCRL